MSPFLEKFDITNTNPPIRIFVSTSSNQQLIVHPHWHREIEILNFIEGAAKQQIGNSIFDVAEGEIVIITSDQLHSTYSFGANPYKILVYQFCPESFVAPGCSKNERILIEEFKNLLFDTPIKIKSEIGMRLLQCLDEMHREFLVQDKAYEFAIKANVFNFLTLSIRHFKNSSKDTPNNSNSNSIREMLQNSFNLIDEQYLNDISLASAAKASNLSVTHFSKLFKENTGMSFKQYLNFYRINRAEALLLNSSLSIAEIAFECGFGSLSAFIRSFRKFKNTTPSSFKTMKKTTGASNGEKFSTDALVLCQEKVQVKSVIFFTT